MSPILHAGDVSAWGSGVSVQVDSYGLAQPTLVGAVVQPGGGARPGLEGPRLVMRDALHLFSPGARHHDVLATEGTASSSSGWLLLNVEANIGMNTCSDSVCCSGCVHLSTKSAAPLAF